ncbi:MAG: hypothetical protein MJB12_05820 [Firmicutes bacterium]|nr:hypothetical protein [Bacillota bacterium]
MKVDYCKNSVYLSEENIEVINYNLNHHFTRVTRLFEEKNIHANVYLTGSLARSEPAISIIQDEVNLFSDIDFIIAIERDSIHRDWVMGLASRLNEMYPEYKNSVIIVSADNISNFRSCIGNDLLLSLKEPLYERLKIQERSSWIIEREDLFESIVHQFSGYYLNTSNIENGKEDLLGKDKNYSYIKMLLECLRMQLYSEGVVSKGYYNVHAERQDEVISKIVEPSVVEKLVKAREIFGSYEYPSINMYDFLKRVLIMPLGIKEVHNVPIESQIIDRLNQIIHVSSKLLHLYQCGLTSLVLGIEGKYKTHKVFIDLSIKSMLKINDLNLSSNNDFVQLVESLKLSTLSQTMVECLLKKIIASLRCDYLNELTFKNTGEYGFSDIQNHLNVGSL